MSSLGPIRLKPLWLFHWSAALAEVGMRRPSLDRGERRGYLLEAQPLRGYPEDDFGKRCRPCSR